MKNKVNMLEHDLRRRISYSFWSRIFRRRGQFIQHYKLWSFVTARTRHFIFVSASPETFSHGLLVLLDFNMRDEIQTLQSVSDYFINPEQ